MVQEILSEMQMIYLIDPQLKRVVVRSGWDVRAPGPDSLLTVLWLCSRFRHLWLALLDFRHFYENRNEQQRGK